MKYLLILVFLAGGQFAFAQEPSIPPAAPDESTVAEPAADGDEKVDESADDASGTEEPDEASEEEAEESSGGLLGVIVGIFSSGPLGMIQDGGLFMYPILVLGVMACGVIIERYRSLRMLRTDTTALRSEVQGLLREDRVEEALQLCDDEQGPVPAVLSCGLRKYLVLDRLNYDPGKIGEQVTKTMDDYAVHIVAALERHLPILATISSVAPMVGFLGTVSGMITSFSDIREMFQSGGGTNVVEAAADGISVALLTTCFGLIVGIPAFMAYNYFTSVINHFVLEVEESATELIENVTLQTALTQAESEHTHESKIEV